MPSQPSKQFSSQYSLPLARRDFLKNSTAAVVGGMLAGGLSIGRSAHAASGDDLLKVGLIGCGGRGTGAASQALHTQGNVRLVAMADTFGDRLEGSLTELQADLEIVGRIDVPPERRFTGFDAYKQVIDSDVDVVLLTTPPHFRPAQLKAAVAAGKHVFCEKPVAVDAPGVRSVLKTTEEARAKGLAIVSGLCWRYDLAVRDTIKRIQNGAIGNIVAIQENYLTGFLWHRGRKPEWSDMEYQIRNWLYYTWLSGDHNVEQHIHSLDKAMWLMGDKPPVACVGLGGRQVRTGPEWGNIFDHHAVAYEWADGVRVYSFTRQQGDCFPETEDFILGTKGQAKVLANTITGENPSQYPRDKKKADPDMYDNEHVELYDSIRKGEPINNGVYMSYSTLLAIMGRMATYTGQRITWDEALNSQEDLTPKSYALGPVELPEAALKVALPGVTKFI
jgi:predicted dehydrogenase